MRLLVSLAFFLQILAAQQIGYSVAGSQPGPWKDIFGSIGLFATPEIEASVLIARPGTALSPGLLARVEGGAFLIVEGDSPVGRALGFTILDRTVQLKSLLDVHRPNLPLILEQPVDLTEPFVPPGARVFTRERWTGVPAVAGFKKGKGAVLWLATTPGKQGYERFPFLLNAMTDLGFEPPFRGNRLWAFFDYSYRTRVDVDWFAKQWRESGIAALHVAAWHFYDRDPERERYLANLIQACHREGILVYAWLELPHVSDRFWAEHPEWREQTALQQDAQLDWRKLMNLADPACSQAVHAGVESLMRRFDWDGVNFAELYYESLEGAANPARFTPMNSTIRERFRTSPGGFDPLALWSTKKDAASLRQFLDYRASLARSLQDEWLQAAESYQVFSPNLDVVLTHVDDRLDTGMRDAIGADTSRLPALLGRHEFTFLVEDPATVWNQGPKRYPLIASRYPKSPRMAVDINIVDRYQDVYPTKQQAGLELFQLVREASASFGRVALYFENSLSPADLKLLSASAGNFSRATWAGPKLIVDSPAGGGLRWQGSAKVDGHSWPVQSSGTVWLPPGQHSLETDPHPSAFRLLSSSGTIVEAAHHRGGIRFTYDAEAREIARFSAPLRGVSLDGAEVALPKGPLLLPRGRHTVLAWPQADESGAAPGGNTGQTVLPDR